MIPRQILYWGILIVTFIIAVISITRFSAVTAEVLDGTPTDARGLVPFEESATLKQN